MCEADGGASDGLSELPANGKRDKNIKRGACVSSGLRVS